MDMRYHVIKYVRLACETHIAYDKISAAKLHMHSITKYFLRKSCSTCMQYYAHVISML